MKIETKHILLLLFIVSVFFSCKQSGEMSENSRVENIVIDSDKNIQVPYDSLIERIEFIKLETTEDNLIGEISQVLFVDSLLIVVDSKSAKSISVFDLNGDFKNKIGNIGNGPAEFVEISNVIIVPETNHVCVLDRPQKKILYFSLDGQFIRQERQPFMLMSFEYIDSQHIAYNVIAMYDDLYGEYRGKALVVTDTTHRISYGSIDDTYSNDLTFVIHSPLRKFDNQVFFSSNISDSIYLVKNDKLIPKYFIDIKNSIPEIDRSKLTNEILYNYLEKHFLFIGDFIELDDFTYLNIYTPWSYPFAIYSHEKKEVFLTSGEYDNPLHLFFRDAPIARYKDNGVVFTVDSYILHESKESLYTKNKRYKTVLDELYLELELESNPILFIYHLNEKLGDI